MHGLNLPPKGEVTVAFWSRCLARNICPIGILCNTFCIYKIACITEVPVHEVASSSVYLTGKFRLIANTIRTLGRGIKFARAFTVEYFCSLHTTRYIFVFIVYLCLVLSGKLLKAEYILSSLINDNGATGTYIFIFQFHNYYFFGTNFDSHTNFKYSQSDLSNNSLHHAFLFTILC